MYLYDRCVPWCVCGGGEGLGKVDLVLEGGKVDLVLEGGKMDLVLEGGKVDWVLEGGKVDWVLEGGDVDWLLEGGDMVKTMVGPFEVLPVCFATLTVGILTTSHHTYTTAVCIPVIAAAPFP